MGASSWDVTTIYVDTNQWVHAFDMTIRKTMLTMLSLW